MPEICSGSHETVVCLQGYNEKELMSLLPPALARELVEQLYESKIEALPGLRGLPAEVRAALCMSMKPIKVRSNHRSAAQQGALCPESQRRLLLERRR